MKTNLNFINTRCSIFVPKVAYNNDNLTKMMSAFPNFLPSTVQIPPIPLLGLPMIQQDLANQPWQLTSADKQKCITFFDDKIDIVINHEGVKYKKTVLESISADCFSMFEKIINAFGFTSVRLAIAPMLRIPFMENGNSKKYDFLNKVYALNKFEDAQVDNCDFSQVFRINKELNNKTYLINHLTKFSTDVCNAIKDNKIISTEFLNIALDINTFVDPTYNMDVEDLRDFYSKSPTWCDDIVNFYFTNGHE